LPSYKREARIFLFLVAFVSVEEFLRQSSITLQDRWYICYSLHVT